MLYHKTKIHFHIDSLRILLFEFRISTCTDNDNVIKHYCVNKQTRKVYALRHLMMFNGHRFSIFDYIDRSLFFSEIKILYIPLYYYIIVCIL